MDDESPSPDAAPSAADAVVIADFWLRASAYMIDALVIGIAFFPVDLALIAAFGQGRGQGLGSSAGRQISSAADFLIAAGYFILMPPLNRGRTLGKMAAGIAIVRMDGSPMTYERSFLRYIAYPPFLGQVLRIVSAAVAAAAAATPPFALPLAPNLSFLLAAFTKDHRACHDYLAGTRVVQTETLGSARKRAVQLLGLACFIATAAMAAIALFMTRPYIGP
jgi:uncharacterized RDD family membrane protein YckC